jgi:hypothetical protein
MNNDERDPNAEYSENPNSGMAQGFNQPSPDTQTDTRTEDSPLSELPTNVSALDVYNRRQNPKDDV